MGVLLLAGLIVAIVAIVRFGKTNRRDPDGAMGRGLEIIEERFARGEIDADTFRAMKAELTI